MTVSKLLKRILYNGESKDYNANEEKVKKSFDGFKY